MREAIEEKSAELGLDVKGVSVVQPPRISP